MSAAERLDTLLGLATLRATRGRLRGIRPALAVAGIAIAFSLLSMWLGQMLVFEPVRDSSVYGVTVVTDPGGITGATQWWDYPGLLVVGSWGVLALPFFPTVAMVLVALGVGVGATVGAALLAPLLRRAASGTGAAVGAAASVGPMITGLATVGSCCCSTCAGVVGVSVVAAASGASLSDLLFNNWYIGAFQLAVVYVSLLAQERVLRLETSGCAVAPRYDRRFVAGAALRLALLVGGITWSLAMFLEYAEVGPLGAGGALWYHWVFEHQLLALSAIAAGLFPQEFAGLVRRFARSLGGALGRVALGVAAWSWGFWVPASLVGLGLGGFVNELFGAAGVSGVFGPVPPDASLGAPLLFHWIFQHGVLSVFALAVAVAPEAATEPLLWSSPALGSRAVDSMTAAGVQDSVPAAA